MSFFRYPGGKSKLKNTLISKISEKLTDPDIEYREPFFGGGSVGINLMLNTGHDDVWFNDKDAGIACIWTTVINNPDALKERVASFIPTTTAFYEFKDQLLKLKAVPDTLDEIVEAAFRKIALHQISYSGLGTKSGGPLGGVDQKSAYKIDCRWSPAYIIKKIDKLHKLLDAGYIRQKQCTNYDFEDVILEEYPKSVIYLDPPYYEKGNELYQEGFTWEDHLRLRDALKGTDHDWVLSYDDCEEVRMLYSWANISTVDVNYSITALKDSETGETSSRIKGELIITND